MSLTPESFRIEADEVLDSNEPISEIKAAKNEEINATKDYISQYFNIRSFGSGNEKTVYLEYKNEPSIFKATVVANDFTIDSTKALNIEPYLYQGKTFQLISIGKTTSQLVGDGISGQEGFSIPLTSEELGDIINAPGNSQVQFTFRREIDFSGFVGNDEDNNGWSGLKGKFTIEIVGHVVQDEEGTGEGTDGDSSVVERRIEIDSATIVDDNTIEPCMQIDFTKELSK